MIDCKKYEQPLPKKTRYKKSGAPDLEGPFSQIKALLQPPAPFAYFHALDKDGNCLFEVDVTTGFILNTTYGIPSIDEV